MKKKYCLIILFLTFFLFGCDDINFGIQEVYNTYLLLEGVTDSDITVMCKCEKLNIPDFTQCEEKDSDTMSNFTKTYNLSGSNSYRFFYVPHNWQIKDHKNLKIFFTVTVNGVLYETSLDIPTLSTQTEDGKDKVNFMLYAENGNPIPAVFTWDLHETI
jgi:hypothetical protein